MTKETRSIEREVFIEADPERVWHALTDAEEIVKWFALKAETQPGVGGYISLSWDLKAVEPDRCHILEWDPGKHLLMTWRDAPGGDNELPVEITLIRRQGGTLLRLVHSGFLSDASWDEEYESHGRGWSYELRSLKYYLERQFGRSRQYVLQRFPLHGDRGATWSDVVGPSGAFAVGSDDLPEGAEFRLRLPTGATTSAELLYFLDGRDFVATARILQGGLFRIALEMISGEPEVWIWAFSWQLGQEAIRAIVQPVFDAVAERLAGRPKSQSHELN
jgi:uncharacterized protein YndB with AHSA1/START domain